MPSVALGPSEAVALRAKNDPRLTGSAAMLPIMFLALLHGWTVSRAGLASAHPRARRYRCALRCFRSLKTTQTGMLLSHRPLIVVEPKLVRSSDEAAVVTVRNIGAGAALNVYAECANIWQVGARGYGPISWGRATGISRPLAPDESAEIRMVVPDRRQTLRDPFRLRVVLRYESLSDTKHWTDMYTGRDDDGWPTKTGNGTLPRPLRKLVPDKHPVPIPKDAPSWRKALPKVRHPRHAVREAWEWRALDVFEWDETDTLLGHVTAKAIVRETGSEVVVLVHGYRFEYRTSVTDRPRLWNSILEHATERLCEKGVPVGPEEDDE